MLQILQFRRGRYGLHLHLFRLIQQSDAQLRLLMQYTSLLVENPLILRVLAVLNQQVFVLLNETEALIGLDEKVEFDGEYFPLIGQTHRIQTLHCIQLRAVHQLVDQTGIGHHVLVQRFNHHLVLLAPHLNLVDPEGIELLRLVQLYPRKLEIQRSLEVNQLRELKAALADIVFLHLVIIVAVLTREKSEILRRQLPMNPHETHPANCVDAEGQTHRYLVVFVKPLFAKVVPTILLNSKRRVRLASHDLQ